MTEFIRNFLAVGWSLYLDAGFWVVISLLTGGLLHTFVPQESFKRWLGTTRFKSIALATGVGVILPICSCGVVPLGLALYWSGASLAATVAFMVATPIINPAAALMAYGVLGPELATVYVIAGLSIPPFIAYSSLIFAPELQYAHGFGPRAADQFTSLQPLVPKHKTSVPAPPTCSCCSGAGAQCSTADSDAQRQHASCHPFTNRIAEALRWGFTNLGLSVCKYILYGIAIASLIFVLIPAWVVTDYLGKPDVLSYGGSVLLGAVMYVCSVGHIPVVAALIAMGANPGVAMTFLLSGVATNLPELISISRLIKLKIALLYAGGLIVISVLVGIAVNLLFMPGLRPVYSVKADSTVLTIAKTVNLTVPAMPAMVCALVILGIGLWAAIMALQKHMPVFNGVKRHDH